MFGLPERERPGAPVTLSDGSMCMAMRTCDQNGGCDSLQGRGFKNEPAESGGALAEHALLMGARRNVLSRVPHSGQRCTSDGSRNPKGTSDRIDMSITKR